MAKGYFITGTDTGVGKTLVAGGIAALLKNITNVEDEYALINPVNFEQSLAPSIAARLSNTKIDIEKIHTSYDILCERHDYMIVEGIGGIMVPIEEYYFVVDMAEEMELPVIV